MPNTPSQQEGSSSSSTAKKTKRANRLSLTKQKADARRAARASELESEDTCTPPASAAAAAAAVEEMGDTDPADAAAAVDDDVAAAISAADLPMEDGEPAANGTPRSSEPAPASMSTAARMHQQEEDANAAARGGDADTSANSKAKTPSWAATVVDRDVISAFQLRTVLATDVPFLSAWHVMESLGWRHKGGMYSTPGGKRAGSSIEAFEMLDRYGGIRPRGEAMPTAVAGVRSEEVEEARTMRRIRDELLEGYCRYHKFKAEERQEEETEKAGRRRRNGRGRGGRK